MIWQEWVTVEQTMVALWPSYAPTAKEVRLRGETVAQMWPTLTQGEAIAAVRDIAQDGERFAPTPGQVVARAKRAPSWDEARALIDRATRNGGGQDREARLATLPVAVAAWARPRWHDLCYSPVAGDSGGAIRGAWRKEYEAYAASGSEVAARVRRELERRTGPALTLADLAQRALNETAGQASNVMRKAGDDPSQAQRRKEL